MCTLAVHTGSTHTVLYSPDFETAESSDRALARPGPNSNCQQQLKHVIGVGKEVILGITDCLLIEKANTCLGTKRQVNPRPQGRLYHINFGANAPS